MSLRCERRLHHHSSSIEGSSPEPEPSQFGNCDKAYQTPNRFGFCYSSILNFAKLLLQIPKKFELRNPLTYIIEIYKELEKPVEDEGLKELMRSRHLQYMKTVWNINKVAELIQFSIIFIISFLVPYDDPLRINFKIQIFMESILN